MNGPSTPKVRLLTSSVGHHIATELNQSDCVSCYGSVNPSATIKNVVAKVDQGSRIQEPDYLVLMGGSNNVFNNDISRDVITAIDNLIVQCRHSSPGATVVVSSMLRCADQPHLDKRIETINPVLKKKFVSSGFVFMDSASQEMRAHLRRDGLHLNPRGVAKLAQIIEGTPLQAKHQPHFAISIMATRRQTAQCPSLC